MKPTLELLCKALSICAEAHGAQFRHYSEDFQCNITSNTVPTLADVQAICDSFYGQHGMIDADFGITVFFDEAEFADHVDEALLYSALPVGTRLEE